MKKPKSGNIGGVQQIGNGKREAGSPTNGRSARSEADGRFGGMTSCPSRRPKGLSK